MLALLFAAAGDPEGFVTPFSRSPRAGLGIETSVLAAHVVHDHPQGCQHVRRGDAVVHAEAHLLAVDPVDEHIVAVDGDDARLDPVLVPSADSQLTVVVDVLLGILDAESVGSCEHHGLDATRAGELRDTDLLHKDFSVAAGADV